MSGEVLLRYGTNPHQTPARVYACDGRLPFRVLNGRVGYINLLDALNAWQLVRELNEVTGLPSAASFKHVSPSGVGLGLPLSEPLQKAYRVENLELSTVAAAYARARGADRVCSFGDWVAVSDVVDMSLARLLRQEVSDGIIAPEYQSDALALLSRKKNGAYVVLEMDSNYQPPPKQIREVYGVALQEKRNDAHLDDSLLEDVVTENKTLTDAARRDALLAMVTLKYTQSNSVCLAANGQTIGIGAGQQSRVHCTRIACDKADLWWLRQHPRVAELKFKSGLKRPDLDNGVELFLRDDVTQAEENRWKMLFEAVPTRLTYADKRDRMADFGSTVLSSDGYIPFRDSIDRAAQSGVLCVVQPGGSSRDPEVIAACDEYGMAMAVTGVRLFHH